MSDVNGFRCASSWILPDRCKVAVRHQLSFQDWGLWGFLLLFNFPISVLGLEPYREALSRTKFTS